ncbi:phosphotransferase [Candidatus Poribacteria bacterium]|nr:phosphotransferase [Candidatus Poribacteria bacterium]
MVLSTIKYPPIAEGATAEVFAWDADKILKLYHEGASPGEAEQEAACASIAHDAGLNTPAVIDTINIENRQGIIFERVQGVTMVEAIIANPQKLVPYAHLLAELQADVSTRTTSKLPLQRKRLQRQIQSVSRLAKETKVAILTGLDRLQDDNEICHGDFHPGNILLTAEEPVIIDWVDATQGSPVVDVARTTLLLQISELPSSMDEPRRQKAAELRHLFCEAYLEHYRHIQSISRKAIARWELPVAAARLSEGIGNDEKAELLEIINAAFP